MGSLDRPKLRSLSAQRFEHEGRAFAALEDPLEAFTEPVLIPLDGFYWVVRHFDGETTLTVIQARILRETGQHVTTAELERLVAHLDQAMVLDGPTYDAF